MEGEKKAAGELDSPEQPDQRGGGLTVTPQSQLFLFIKPG